jgi:hypothetical protein
VQFLENRQFQIEEIARWYRIPPHKLAHIVKSTFNNIEEQNINYVQDALLPWTNRWESEGDRKLLAPGERGNTRIKFNLNTLLRGAIEKRFASYATGRQWGWLSPNDVRGYEDQDPLPAELGDSYITPMNMTPTELLGQEPEPAPAADSDQDPDNDEDDEPGGPGAHLRPVMVDAIQRCMNREIKHAARAPKSIGTQQEFVGWSAKFYARHGDYCTAAILPGCIAAMVQAIGKTPKAMASVLQVFVEDFIADTRAIVQSARETDALNDIDIDGQASVFADRLASSIGDLISLAATEQGNEA